MIVMKFGGTSVGSPERMEEVVQLVSATANKNGPVVVVLSAMSGITNSLIAGAELALARDLDGAVSTIESIREKHFQAIDKLFGGDPTIGASLKQEIQAYLDDLLILYRGVGYLGELSKRSLDAISGMGELLSSKIVAALAGVRGLSSCWLDARKMMITDEGFGKAAPLWDKLTSPVRSQMLPRLEAGQTIITQGFIGSTIYGISTTLGRGGSDYSASIFGVALDASEIQIWTDVDGMMSADPRVVRDARVLPEVSFQEASELAYFGAKVLHPMTIRPAVEKKIPVRILNTMNPTASGTLIKNEVESRDLIRAVAAKKRITAVYLSSPNMLMSHGYLAKVFEIFDRYKIPVDLISTSEVSIALTIDTDERIDELEAELVKHAEVHVNRNVAIVSVVGRQFRVQSGIAGRVFRALSDINVLMISGGASDINLSFVVAGADADRAVQQLHSEFFVAAEAAV
jgi:aspartate kinase